MTAMATDLAPVVIRAHDTDPTLVYLDTRPDLAPVMGGFQPARFVGRRSAAYVMPVNALPQWHTFARHHGIPCHDERLTAPPTPIKLTGWCGQCDGPELSRRWLNWVDEYGRECTQRCPRCHPGYVVTEEATSVTVTVGPTHSPDARPATPDDLTALRASIANRERPSRSQPRRPAKLTEDAPRLEAVRRAADSP